jgi:hypothetical protein
MVTTGLPTTVIILVRFNYEALKQKRGVRLLIRACQTSVDKHVIRYKAATVRRKATWY